MRISLAKCCLLVIGMLLLLLVNAPSSPRSIADALTITPVEPATRTPQPAAAQTTEPAVLAAANQHNDSAPKLADPAITKEISSAAKIGEQAFFTISVTNNGPQTARGVVLTDPIPDYMDVIEATSTRGAVSSQGRTVIVAIGRVAPDEEVTIRITVRINERARPPGARNRFSLTTTSPGDDPTNNAGVVTFVIVGAQTSL